METINFSKYKRSFLFGCSFTKYYWPTWADLVSREIPETYVYAKTGAGNFYIYQAFIEALVKHKINENDLVMIMFSNVTREDRYTKQQGWITPGNLFFQNTYDKNFIDTFFCEKGYLMRDLSLIEGLIRILKSIGVDYSLMSIVPLNSYSSDSKLMDNVDDVLSFYKSTLEQIKPSVLDIVFKGDWNSSKTRPKYKAHWSPEELYTDNHPTPLEHLDYILKVFPQTKFSNETVKFASESCSLLLKCKTYKDIIDVFPQVDAVERL